MSRNIKSQGDILRRLTAAGARKLTQRGSHQTWVAPPPFHWENPASLVEKITVVYKRGGADADPSQIRDVERFLERIAERRAQDPEPPPKVRALEQRAHDKREAAKRREAAKPTPKRAEAPAAKPTPKRAEAPAAKPTPKRNKSQTPADLVGLLYRPMVPGWERRADWDRHRRNGAEFTLIGSGPTKFNPDTWGPWVATVEGLLASPLAGTRGVGIRMRKPTRGGRYRYWRLNTCQQQGRLHVRPSEPWKLATKANRMASTEASPKMKKRTPTSQPAGGGLVHRDGHGLILGLMSDAVSELGKAGPIETQPGAEYAVIRVPAQRGSAPLYTADSYGGQHPVKWVGSLTDLPIAELRPVGRGTLCRRLGPDGPYHSAILKTAGGARWGHPGGVKEFIGWRPLSRWNSTAPAKPVAPPSAPSPPPPAPKPGRAPRDAESAASAANVPAVAQLAALVELLGRDPVVRALVGTPSPEHAMRVAVALAIEEFERREARHGGKSTDNRRAHEPGKK